MFRVGVIVPSWAYWINPVKLQPLWELYYATLIQDRFPDAEVRLIDRRGHNLAAADMPECDIYFYWIMKSADAPEVYDLVRDLRLIHPMARHIAGGTHIDHHFAQAPAIFDAAVLGTAEELIDAALHDWKAGKLQQSYRGPDMIHPYAAYGHARRDFLPRDRVVNGLHFQEYGGVPGTGAYFSRGCSFRCRFCIYNNPGKFEYRAGDQIRAEIAYLKSEFGVQGVNLRDEVCIPVNPRLARDYLGAIGDSGVIWRGQTVPLGKEESIRLAAEAGCKELALGIESVDSNKVLKIANKPSQSIDDNTRYIELLKKYGIRVKVCLIMGLPGESKHALERTIRFLDDVKPDYVACSGFDPVPGAPFYKEPEKYGIKTIEKDLSKHAHLVYRFGDEEEVGLPFEYERDGPFGEALTRQEILHNIKSVQGYLRDNGMSY